MAKRREWQIALLAALTAALPGCAGKSILPSWGSSKSTTTESSQSLDALAAKNQAANSGSSGSSVGSGMKKAGSSIADALTIKPKVIPANDATSLNSKTPKLGPDIYISAARVHEARGNMPGAIEQYHKALELAPKDQGALVGLARLHDRQGNFAEAEKLYKKAGEIDPKSPLVWNDLGLCYARQKRLDEATTQLARAIQLQPQNAMYRNNMATVLVEQGRMDDAWKQLAAVNPPDVAHYNFAFLLHKNGQDQQATQHLQQALAANPSMDAAQQLLAKLDGGELPSEVAVSAPQNPARYSISDDAGSQDLLVAHNGPTEIVNPLAPGGRRSATYRMPPTEEQSQDPAPPPTATRLPVAEEEVEPEVQGPELNFNVPERPTYRTRRTAHVEEPTIQQPKNVIRLLGSEPIAAPIPQE